MLLLVLPVLTPPPLLEALSQEDIPRDTAVNELPMINIIAIVIVTMPNKL
jgi:hypothetical protein